eukprot:TRINITY_DN55850_c0_g1_i1.p1 TRINITY_DN55850_c0_g1~~TRINITY_DN55850_c0_g1_i1.p1  ORF type:complete len:345 (+),score=80.36 TRINITY_DN55850_c0_g1_i1:18-1052(+)
MVSLPSRAFSRFETLRRCFAFPFRTAAMSPLPRPFIQLKQLEGERESFKVMTWNILDDEYCQNSNVAEVREYEPNADEICHWNYRLPLILREIGYYNADIVALQEVSPHMFQDLKTELLKLGYEGVCDGEVWTVATFWRQPWRMRAWKWQAEEPSRLLHRLSLAAREVCPPDATYFFRALAVALERGSSRVLVANIHTDWRDGAEVRHEQVRKTLQVGAAATVAAGWRSGANDVGLVLCGDLNDEITNLSTAIETYDLLDAHDSGQMQDASSSDTEAEGGEQLPFTYGTKEKPEIIDHVFHSKTLSPVRFLARCSSRVLGGRAGIPHAQFPSDHVPLLCEFVFA